MMRFDVYCDESRPDLLSSSNPEGSYLVIGSLWLPSSLRARIKAEIHALRDKHRVGSEAKWHKVSPSRFAFYREMVEFVREGANESALEMKNPLI